MQARCSLLVAAGLCTAAVGLHAQPTGAPSGAASVAAPVSPPVAPSGPASTADPYAEAVVAARLLELVNQARTEPRDCGKQRFAAAPPLRRHPQLDAAARAHVQDMAARGFFSLTGGDGSTTETRVEREGYRWSGVGENLIERHFSAEPIVQSWLTDPMQCSNIMHPAFVEVGIARSAWQPGSRSRVVWSMVVARPRGVTR